MTRRAVILLSGGLDSATTLAAARCDGFDCYALSVFYGQLHSAELRAAERVVGQLGARQHRHVTLDLGQFGGSALTDPEMDIPQKSGKGVPATYVPARNTVLLSVALAWAETLAARDIFIGVNAVDYSGYPDCRPEFIAAFQRLSNVATRAGTEEGAEFRIHSPLMELSKAQIIRLGSELGVDFAETVSCYAANEQGRACGRCDSCRLRARGFAQAGIADPTVYQSPAVKP
jgi:7-cyano-7-deazaguanine synthase